MPATDEKFKKLKIAVDNANKELEKVSKCSKNKIRSECSQVLSESYVDFCKNYLFWSSNDSKIWDDIKSDYDSIEGYYGKRDLTFDVFLRTLRRIYDALFRGSKRFKVSFVGKLYIGIGKIIDRMKEIESDSLSLFVSNIVRRLSLTSVQREVGNFEKCLLSVFNRISKASKDGVDYLLTSDVQKVLGKCWSDNKKEVSVAVKEMRKKGLFDLSRAEGLVKYLYRFFARYKLFKSMLPGTKRVSKRLSEIIKEREKKR